MKYKKYTPNLIKKIEKYSTRSMKEISETIETYPEGIVLGVVLGVMAYSNPINLDPDILYQSANYLKDVITHINPY